MSKHTNLSIINYLVILVVHDHNHGVVVHGLALEKYNLLAITRIDI